MINDPPDDRSLAVYAARARLHADTLAWSDDALISLNGTDSKERKVRLLALQEQARRGLRVTELLLATWQRDHAERQEWRDRAERVVRERYKDFSRRHKR